jgi:hypothetical protein
MALTSEEEIALLAFMASYEDNKKRISDLESAVTADADHLLPVEKAGATKNISVDDIKDFVIANFPNASETVKGFLELLTNAELAAGTDTTRAATAAAIASLFGASLRSTNGYARLPVKVGGAFVEIIMQWGIVAAASIPSITTNYTVALPMTYPNANLIVTAPVPTNGSYTSGSNGNTVIISKSVSNFVFAHGQSPALDVMYFSIGY